MNERDSKLLSAMLAAHQAMSSYEHAVRVTQSNIEAVDMLLRARDPAGYISEILRVSRQATVLTECAKEAHDALVTALGASNG
jgi:hypothetical protein